MSAGATIAILWQLQGRRGEGVLSRFYNYVDAGERDACWPWTGGVDAEGYGRFKINSYVNVCASRAALVIATGEEHMDMEALHSCDNPPCCNPGHLRWGTPKDNAGDKMERGRWRGQADQSGSANGAAKLSDEQLFIIVGRLKAGLNNKRCAEGMPVGHAMISKIRVGEMWRPQTAALGWEPRPQFQRKRAA